eukprot:1071279-Pleurochrysis_carterae.AAC.2
MIASARASCCTLGRTIARSSGGTPAFTPSAPPRVPPAPSLATRCRACSITSRGCSLHGTNGRWREGWDTHSSRRSVSTAAAAAAAWATRPGWWKARTVRSSQSDLASTPPSPACETISLSPHAIASAAARSAPRSSCLAPAKAVSRVERWTGRQSAGSAQSQTTPLAHRGISSCVTVTVATLGTCASPPPARVRSAATAASAVRSHACTLSA